MEYMAMMADNQITAGINLRDEMDARIVFLEGVISKVSERCDGPAIGLVTDLKVMCAYALAIEELDSADNGDEGFKEQVMQLMRENMGTNDIKIMAPPENYLSTLEKVQINTLKRPL